MNQQFFRFIFFLLVCLTLPLSATAQVVDIPDPKLRAAIQISLGKPSGHPITANEMVTLTSLDASGADIRDLTGLEGATNLTTLFLMNNNISDISALAGLTNLRTLLISNNSISDISALVGLTNLRTLFIRNNSISDISALAGLTQLTELSLSISDISALAGLTNLRTLYLSSSSISDISALAGLTQLTRLGLSNNSISDISALAGLTQLTELDLTNNSISDISALAGLTQLTELDLRNNSISDISPLVANMGLGSGDEVKLRENRLSALSFTHISTLQSRGVRVDAPAGVWGVGEPYTVRLIYFLPNGRPPQPDIDTKMDALIKNTQQFYTEMMVKHGFSRKTFTFETDEAGKAVVHHVIGQFDDTYYQDRSWRVWEEIHEQFDWSKNIYLCALDVSSELIHTGSSELPEVCGLGGGGSFSGNALIPASGGCFNVRTTAHELGHAFGLHHDNRLNGKWISTSSADPMVTSFCAAEWLDVHRYFNAKQSSQNASGATVQMFPPSLAFSPNGIRLRFEVADTDGLHQVQLHTPEIKPYIKGGFLGCKRLTGTSSTVEFITTELTSKTESVSLQVIDIHGNFSGIDTRFPINIASLLPPPELVSIPDANLAAAVRRAPSWTQGNTLTSHTMLELGRLYAQNFSDDRKHHIINLTGLEYAINLIYLDLQGNSVSDISPVAGLTNLTYLHLQENSVSDISPVAGLTNLTYLHLYGNSVSDISALAGLIQLTELYLDNNSISDISALAKLPQLTTLHLQNNSISDISALAGLTNLATNLTTLKLHNNSISDISPLVANTGLGYGRRVDVRENPLSYASIHTHIPTLQSRGVRVEFDNRILKTFQAVSRIVVTEPDNVLIVEAKDSNGLVFEGVPVTFTVTSGGGTLSATRTTTDADGRAESRFTLGTDEGLQTVHASVEGISKSVTFSNVAVNIPDPNLHAAIVATLGKPGGTPIVLPDMSTLSHLEAQNANISNLTGLETAINLRTLELHGNSVSDISVLAGLTQLNTLFLQNNSISDISALAGLTQLKTLNLSDNSISDMSALAGLTQLPELYLRNNSISDISALTGLTQLTELHLDNNSISDISALTGLTHLKEVYLSHNLVSDISPLAANVGLGDGDTIRLIGGNRLSYASIHTHIPTLQNRGATVEFHNLAYPGLLKISGDNQKGIAFTPLSQPFVVEVQNRHGVPLAGISVMFDVTAGGGIVQPKMATTNENGRAESTLTLGPNLITNTVKVSAVEIKRTATFYALCADLPTKYLWSIPTGISLIHLPLKVTAVDSVAGTIKSIADLYDALGGADTVSFLTTHDPTTQRWHSYLGDSSRGTAADKVLTDDQGIIAVMNNAVSLRLSGDALGTNESSSITLHPGTNLVGVPLRDSRIARVSGLFTLDGIGGNVSVIRVSSNKGFRGVRQAGGDDILITGGQSFILMAQQAATVAISGGAWYNISETATVLPPIIPSIEVGDATPVLVLGGSIVGEGIRVDKAGFRVIVKNLSTGREVALVIGNESFSPPDKVALNSNLTERIDYQLTIVDTERGRVAMIGDILEISAYSSDPLIGVQSLQHTVTAENVRQSQIQLPVLIGYKVLWETELLQNYPNPFTPETWIPYRLAEEVPVTLTIYDTASQIVRTLDVGHRIAAIYESESKAIYWDGRNDVGERVASGVYFYTLTAGDYSATRKMVILK